ncbi:MAG: hypothetical protein FWF00_01645 [Endomicrobia bacterium]|nr:hypothetical protein [Endomicrobiia bacterium]
MSYKIKRLLAVLFLFMFIAPVAFCIGAEVTASDSETVKTKNMESAAVSPFGNTLFYVYGNIGSVSAEKRAENISQNIRKLKKDILFKPSLLTISSENGMLGIVYMNNVIADTTEKEAQIEGVITEDLAKSRLDIIASAVEKERPGNIRSLIVKQIVIFLTIVVFAFLAIKYLNVLYRYAIRLTQREKNDAGKTITSIVSISKQVKILHFVLNILRILIFIFMLYCCFLLLLSFFPET